MENKIRNMLLAAQKNEITEQKIYFKLAAIEKSQKNRQILQKISAEEMNHYIFFKKLTGQDVKEDLLKIQKYYWLSKIFGLTFALKLMESDEAHAQDYYDEIQSSKKFKGLKKVIQDEENHEKSLLNMIDEERLEYVGSLVLGVNDALVELTGALAGLTFALGNTIIIGFAGLITGISATLSMAASEYLSKKAEESNKNPLKAAVYTGIMYLVTVILLVLPYFLIKSVFVALLCTILIGFLIVAIFQFYISVAKEVPFKKRFLEMAGISTCVAIITFAIGYLFKIIFNIQL